MKTARLLRWSGSALSASGRSRSSLNRSVTQLSSSATSPSTSRSTAILIFSSSSRSSSASTRKQCTLSSAQQRRTLATAAAVDDPVDTTDADADADAISEDILLKLPSPPITAAQTSPQLAALHARLLLSSQFPIETLARTLVDPSADPDAGFNNAALAKLGADLLSYYTSEYIICQYPRLPLAVVFAAMNAYCGPKALSAIRREWGVHPAAAPGGEVDPGFLQLKHVPPTQEPELPVQQVITTRESHLSSSGLIHRHSLSSRTVHDDEFGNRVTDTSVASRQNGVTLDSASAEFVRAVIGAVYVHSGRSAAKKFFKDHFMSRQLNMAALMSFQTPTRDLSKLCAREGFASPVARILSETGRRSRSPVFVVGVFSGNEKLGEGAGASLDEARTRAAVAALKGWYLYSPVDWRLPSDAEESGSGPWQPQHVDLGDVVT